MLAASLGPEQAVEYIKDADLEECVRVAAINLFDSVTISGDAEPVEELSAKLTQESVFNRLVHTGGLAYHSHHMLLLGPEYEKKVNGGLCHLEELSVDIGIRNYPNIPWVSSVMPNKGTAKVTVSYWRANLESVVCFTDAVSKLLDLPDLNIGALLEIGLHPAFKSPLGQIMKNLGKTILHVLLLKRNEDAQRLMLDCTGSLFALNANINLAAVNTIDRQVVNGE